MIAIIFLITISCINSEIDVGLKIKINEILFHFEELSENPCDNRLYENEFSLEFWNNTNNEIELKFEDFGLLESKHFKEIDTFLITGQSLFIYPNEKIAMGCKIRDNSFNQLFYSELCKSKDSLIEYFNNISISVKGIIINQENNELFSLKENMLDSPSIFFISNKGESIKVIEN